MKRITLWRVKTMPVNILDPIVETFVDIISRNIGPRIDSDIIFGMLFYMFDDNCSVDLAQEMIKMYGSNCRKECRTPLRISLSDPKKGRSVSFAWRKKEVDLVRKGEFIELIGYDRGFGAREDRDSLAQAS